MQLSQKQFNPIHCMSKLLNEIGHVFDGVVSFIGFVAILVLNVFAPIGFNIKLVCYLIFVDVACSLISQFMERKRANKSLRRAFAEWWADWTPERGFDSIPKAIFYCLLITGAYYAGQLFAESMAFARVFTGLICYVELRSIIRHGDRAFNTNMFELLGEYFKKLLPGKKQD